MELCAIEAVNSTGDTVTLNRRLSRRSGLHGWQSLFRTREVCVGLEALIK